MIRAFLLGMREFRRSVTTRTEHPLAYDHGRDLAHVLTFRYWDN